MPKADDRDTYTRHLSDRIDSAYAAFKDQEPGAHDALYEALEAQARNLIWQKGLEPCIHDWGNLPWDLAHRALFALPSFRDESKLSTWFYRIAMNGINDALRLAIYHRNTVEPLDDGDHERKGRHSEIPVENVDYDDALVLAKVRQGLPSEQATVLDLKLEGYTLEEIAARTEEPLGTIRSRYRLLKRKGRKKQR